MHDDESPSRPPAAPSSRPAPLRRFAVAALVCLLALIAVAGAKTWRDLARVEAREGELRHEIDETREEIQRLEVRLERLRSDPAALEEVAREELHMIYPGEVVVVLPDAAGPDATGPTAAAPNHSAADSEPSP